MSEEIHSLKVLVVSEAAPERELLRQVALQASVPVEFSEADRIGDRVAATSRMTHQNYDVVFFDSRLPKIVKQEFLNIIRAAPSHPLAVLVGPAVIKTREVLTEGLQVDSVLAKPIDLAEASELIERCVRARLPKNVLIVDDAATVRAVVRKVMQASRFKLNAEEAEDGASALALAKRKQFDIVFLDYQMPGLDGFATLAQIRLAHPGTQVVMITGTRDHRIEDRARAEGAKDFLFKPFFAKDVDAVLNRLFGLSPP
jgi:CheY-like chemotaxis protein